MADQKRAKFNSVDGDHLTLLNLYESWKQNNFSKIWCRDNFIQVNFLNIGSLDEACARYKETTCFSYGKTQILCVFRSQGLIKNKKIDRIRVFHARSQKRPK